MWRAIWYDQSKCYIFRASPLIWVFILQIQQTRSKIYGKRKFQKVPKIKTWICPRLATANIGFTLYLQLFTQHLHHIGYHKWSRNDNLCREDTYGYTKSFYIKDLNIRRFCYPKGSYNQSPSNTEGKLYTHWQSNLSYWY